METAQEIQRIEASRRRARELAARGLRRLDQVVGDDAGKGRGELPDAAAALAHLLAAVGAGAAVAAADRGRLANATTITSAAQTLGLRLRRVVLPADWRARDQGPLIFDRSETDGGPVCAVFRAGGYRLVDNASGGETPVGHEIGEVAYVAYPPLPRATRSLMSLARFLLPTIRGELVVVACLGAAIALVGAALPLAAAFIIDELVPSGERGMLVQVGCGLALAAFLTFVLAAVREFALLRLDGRAAVALDAAVWDRVLTLPARFFSGYASGDLRHRIGGVARMRNVIAEVALSAVFTAVFSLFYLGLLFYFDISLALIGVAIVLLLALVTFLVGLRQIAYNRRRIEAASWLSGFVFQALQGIVKLRVAGAEDRAFARWADRFADERIAIRRARRIGEHFAAFADAYGAVALAILFVAAYRLSSAELSPGAFIAFLAAFGSLQGAFQGLSQATLQVAAAAPEWERGRPVLAEEPESQLAAADPGRLSGAIEATQATFAYGDGPPAVREVSIEARPGEHIALVGPSGSGKSTLLRLLLGLESPDTGAILYDGQDLRSLDKTLVRRQIGVVTQNGRLFAGSIMENIRGVSDAGFEACLEAAEAAGLAEDLASFPMGLHTPLTEGAPTLSGGQRQRLLIARALVGKPRIIAFDEATSALDNRTQAIVVESVRALKATRIVVAHRLSTIQDADRIYVIDDGRVVETGDYAALMAKDSLFAALARRQIA